MHWLLLDRDDTILNDPGYLSDPEKVCFLPGAIKGLLAFHRAGWPLVIVSNQSGLGRGLITPSQLEAVHRRLKEELKAHDILLSGIYFCPHAPEQNCSCRKPKPELAMRAAADLGLSLKKAIVVGDKESDLELGKRIGAAYIAQIAAKGQSLSKLANAKFSSIEELATRIIGKRLA